MIFAPFVAQGSHFKRPVRYLPLNLNIAEKVGNRKLEGHHYLKLGDSYSETSHFQEAIDSYEEYKRICEKQGDEAEVGHAHGRLGKVYLSVGKIEEARNNFELQLRTAKKVGDRKEEGRAIGSLGSIYLRLHNLETAYKKFNDLLEISQELKDRSGEGDAYGNLGMVHHLHGNCTRAREYLLQNLTIVQELDDRAGEGKAYSNLGRVYRRLDDFERALEYHELQLRIAVEEGRMGDEARAYYEMGCNLELLDFEEKTLTFYKLSVLLFNDIRANLRFRERSAFKDEWKINLFHEFKHVYTALCRTLLKDNSPLEALWAAEQGRAQALADLLVSRYGILSGEQIGTASGILKHISTNTVFLEIDSKTIYLWLLKPGQPVHFRKRSCEVDATSFLGSLIENAYRSIDVNWHFERGYIALKEHLSPFRIIYDILFSAIVDLIQDDELVIVPCGHLWLAPLAAIVDHESKYLCESFRIRLAPSLKFLKLIAECPRSYHRESGALIVGDPLIEGRVRYSGRLKSFAPLPHARQEAQMIGRLTNSKPLIGREATKMAVLEQLNSAALIHFATHCDATTGDILLAPPPNPTRPFNIPEEKDYTLTIDEVLNMNVRAKLVRAKLVNLSCCDSGHGKIKAEGLVGMGRAFLAAGARSVLVSLWAIDDQATFEFMKSFYQHLAEGKKASEALNMAMRCRRESEKFNEVKHWASFVLIGDDVTLEFLHNTSQV